MSECDSHTHIQVPFGAAESLTWRLAVEIVRRHPAELWLVRTYPMDGQYDCLTVRRLAAPMSGPSIEINRRGTHVSISWFGPERDKPQYIPLASWGDPFHQTDPREWIRMVELSAGLNTPHGLPPSTSSSIGLRWIAAFLGAQLGSRHRWTANTAWPNSGQNDLPAEFIGFPQVEQWTRSLARDDAALLTWFIGRRHGPELAVCADGTFHRRGEPGIDLLAAYRTADSSMTNLLASTAADLLG